LLNIKIQWAMKSKNQSLAEISTRKPVVLCVDDEKFVLDTLHQQLSSAFGRSFEYEIAQSVEEAWMVIEDLQNEGIELVMVISDWLMPDTKGDQFLIELHQRFPKTIKIMISAQADPESVDRATRNANLNLCLPKPWKTEILLERMTQMLAFQ